MRKIISLVAIISFLALAVYLFFEPEMIKGADISVSQTVTAEITLDCSTSVSGLTNIPGVTGGTSDGTFSCTATTNNDAGYNLKLKKNAQLCHSVAGCGTDQQFNDYTGPTNDPIHYNWAPVAAGAEEWGFNMKSGGDITQRFRDNGSACNVGTQVTDGKCWVRIPTSPTEETVANRNSPTAAGGSASGFGVRIQAGASNLLRSGTYTTTLVATAAMN